MRALLLQAMTRSPLILSALRSEDIDGAPKLKVTARIRGLGRQDDALEQMVVRLSLEPGVSSVSWVVERRMIAESDLSCGTGSSRGTIPFGAYVRGE